jgi:bifunctional non-homologous end joining protein LigD
MKQKKLSAAEKKNIASVLEKGKPSKIPVNIKPMLATYFLLF